MTSIQTKTFTTLAIVGLIASLSWVRQVHGNGPTGGDVIPGPPPPATLGPGSKGKGSSSAGWIRVLSSLPFSVEPGSLTSAAVVVGQHSGSDLATTGPATDEDSVELRLKDDTLEVWSGLNQVRLNGRFTITDWDENDGEKISLAAGIGGRGLEIGDQSTRVGERHAWTQTESPRHWARRRQPGDAAGLLGQHQRFRPLRAARCLPMPEIGLPMGQPQ